MAKAVATLLLTIAAGCLLVSLTSAKNTVCFNANGVLKRVFCGGRDITGRLPNRDNPSRCDCIDIDVCKNITIRAEGYQLRDNGQTRSGIGVCQTVYPTPYRDWVCTKSSLNRGWKSQSMNTKNSNHWRPAQVTTRARTCQGKKKLPCKPLMFWNEGVDKSSIDCVLQQCGDECKSCAIAGPGRCDAGMCNFGVGVNNYTRKERCNRRCRLDMKTFGHKDTITRRGNGYMKLVDLRSHSRDYVWAHVPGYYLAIIDVDRCEFKNKTFKPWTPDVQKLNLPFGLLQDWVKNPKLTNLYAAVLQVGGVDANKVDETKNQWYSGAPYSELYPLGDATGPTPVFNQNRNCSISTVLTGFNYGPTKVDPLIINWRGKNKDASSSCN